LPQEDDGLCATSSRKPRQKQLHRHNASEVRADFSDRRLVPGAPNAYVHAALSLFLQKGPQLRLPARIIRFDVCWRVQTCCCHWRA